MSVPNLAARCPPPKKRRQNSAPVAAKETRIGKRLYPRAPTCPLAPTEQLSPSHMCGSVSRVCVCAEVGQYGRPWCGRKRARADMREHLNEPEPTADPPHATTKHDGRDARSLLRSHARVYFELPDLHKGILRLLQAFEHLLPGGALLGHLVTLGQQIFKEVLFIKHGH